MPEEPVGPDPADRPAPVGRPDAAPTGAAATGIHGPIPDRTTVAWGPVAVFIAIAYGLGWLVMLPLHLGENGLNTVGAWLPVLLPVLLMFTPAIAALIVTFTMKRPGKNRLRDLGIWPLQPWKRTVGVTLAAFVGMWLLLLALPFLTAAVGLVKLDLQDYSMAARMIPPGTPMDPALLAWMQILAAPLNALIVILIPALGEEIGWRGWLLPRLRPLGVWPALILSGAIWGVWHAPITLLGHNYGLYDLRGVGLMTIFCILMGSLLGFLRLRTGSVWPAVFAHASLNASAGALILLGDAEHPPNMILAGPAGVPMWAALAVILAVLAATGQFRKEGQLAGRLPAPTPPGPPASPSPTV